jgi:hypothetical protein
MTKLIVTFPNLVNAPNKKMYKVKELSTITVHYLLSSGLQCSSHNYYSTEGDNMHKINKNINPYPVNVEYMVSS